MKSMKYIKLYITGLIMLFSAGSFAQPGSLDTGFGSGGKVITSIGLSDELGQSIAVYPDGKIVVAGYASNGIDNDFAVARYFMNNGNLDTTFGKDGFVTTAIDSSHDDAFAVAVQPDTKIVVAGRYINSSYDAVAVRYNPDGSLDNTFNLSGIAPVSFSPNFDEALCMGIQPDGKIVIAGCLFNGINYDIALARINPNGSLDNTFGLSGIMIDSIGSGDDVANSLRILPDGRILLAGYSYNGLDDDFVLACYTQTGIPDVNFGISGKVTTDFGHGNDIANSVFDIPEDGKFVVAGSSENGTERDFGVARYHDNGDLDTSFNSVGFTTTAIGESNDDGHSVFPQPDGSLMVSGSTYNGDNWDFALCRYMTEGVLDNTFGTNGIVTTAIDSYNDGINSSVIISDGHLIVAGYSTNGIDADFALAKYYLWTLPVSLMGFSDPELEVQIYPNPVQHEFTLNYTLKEEEVISIRLVDIQGSVLKTYIDRDKQEAGKHELAISLPEGLTPGNYMLVITSPDGKVCIHIEHQ
jgi:uncharacterized delta-60 repeat protein